MATTDDQQERIPLRERFKLATGHDAPVIGPAEKAEYARHREEVRLQAQVIYGDDDVDAA